MTFFNKIGSVIECTMHKNGYSAVIIFSNCHEAESSINLKTAGIKGVRIFVKEFIEKNEFAGKK